jgi:hypothetical protein
MVLKGSLREFILGDIFNLIAQQKITGKLLLSSGNEEGIIVLKDGIIAAAIKGDEHISSKLFNLLVGAYHLPQEEMQGLFTSYESNINSLFNEIVRLNILPGDVLAAFATSITEDICCSFFLWNKGTYYFASVPIVDDIAPNCVSISVEAIAMEASRRVDEWNRMQKNIHPESVFVPTERHNGAVEPAIDPLGRPEDYVYSKIDGMSTVSTLYRNSGLTEYKVYEAINVLLSTNRIAPLASNISQSVVAALEKREMERKKGPKPLTTLATLFVAGGIIISLVFIGEFLMQGLLLSGISSQSRMDRLELPLTESLQKVAIASLQYHALLCQQTSNINDLTSGSYLLKSDLRPLITAKTIKKLSFQDKGYILNQKEAQGR